MKTLTLSMLLLLAAGAALAAVGQLTPASVSPEDAMQFTPFLLDAHAFSKAPPGCGTLAPNALIAKIPGGSPVRVAFDVDTAAKKFTCLRFDFSGTGKFPKAFTTKLTIQEEQGDEYVGNITPRTFTVPLHGRSMLVTVFGQFQHTHGGYALMLFMVTALKGTCQFAGVSYPLRLINSNGSLHCGDKWQLRQARPENNGDLLLIYTGAGKKPLRGYYGQPVQVDGAWYNIQLSEDGKALTAARLTAATGTLQFDYPSWEAELCGNNNYFAQIGSGPATTVPVDNYQIVSFRGSPSPGNKEKAAWLNVSTTNFRGDLKKIDVAPSAKTHVGIGSGITAHINALQDQRDITFAIELRDALGNDIASVMQADGNDAAAQIPFEVVDAKGKRLYSNTFEHG